MFLCSSHFWLKGTVSVWSVLCFSAHQPCLCALQLPFLFEANRFCSKRAVLFSTLPLLVCSAAPVSVSSVLCFSAHWPSLCALQLPFVFEANRVFWMRPVLSALAQQRDALLIGVLVPHPGNTLWFLQITGWLTDQLHYTIWMVCCPHLLLLDSSSHMHINSQSKLNTKWCVCCTYDFLVLFAQLHRDSCWEQHAIF